MERVGRTGTITVDSVKTDFSTPGVSANLIIGNFFCKKIFYRVYFLDEPIYIGGVPWKLIDNNKITKNGTISPQNVIDTKNFNASAIHRTRNHKDSKIQFPSTIWSAHLRLGFIGCLKNLRINGINAQIAHVFEEELKRENLLLSNITSFSLVMSSVKKGFNFSLTFETLNFSEFVF